MEKDLNRAFRRHHEARLKQARRFYHGDDLAKDPVQLGKTVATPSSCSCVSCGNPRKHHGERTVQEQRAMQRDTSDELGIEIEV